MGEGCYEKAPRVEMVKRGTKKLGRRGIVFGRGGELSMRGVPRGATVWRRGETPRML